MLRFSARFYSPSWLHCVIRISSRVFRQRFTTNERFFAIERKVSRQRRSEKTRKSLTGRLRCWENYAAGFRVRRKETDYCNLFSVSFGRSSSFFFLACIFSDRKGSKSSGWIFKEFYWLIFPVELRLIFEYTRCMIIKFTISLWEGKRKRRKMYYYRESLLLLLSLWYNCASY